MKHRILVVEDIHVSHCQGKSTSFLSALGRARISGLIGGAGAAHADHLHLQVSATFLDQDIPHTQQLPLGWWSLHPCRTGHPFAV